MSEIEKMYENTIGKHSYCIANDCLDMSKCENCYFCKQFYPSFTAEKQIELIKWLAEHSDFGTFSPDAEIDKDTKVKIYGFALIMRGEKHYYIDEKFEMALAKCIKNLWQDLTEEERKQVRGILE